MYQRVSYALCGFLNLTLNIVIALLLKICRLAITRTRRRKKCEVSNNRIAFDFLFSPKTERTPTNLLIINRLWISMHFESN